MPDFYVIFTSNTDFNHQLAGLRAVTADYRQSGSTFRFSLNWKTGARDIANLKGRIEGASGRNSVAHIGLDDGSSSSSGSDTEGGSSSGSDSD